MFIYLSQLAVSTCLYTLIHRHTLRIDSLHDAVRTYMRTILSRSLVSFSYGAVCKKQQNLLLLLIYFIARFEMSTECVLIFFSLGCNLVLHYELDQIKTHFIVFSYTWPCQEETNMAAVSMMTCKIGLIWRHMKTLYWVGNPGKIANW